jgi:hypothetical protein
MSGAIPPEQSSPVPRNSKLKKLESRITAARNALDWTTLSALLQQHVADSGRESIGGSYRFSHYTTSYVLARIDMLLFGERDGGLPEVLKFVNEILPTANDKVLLCIIGSVHWCAGAQVRPVSNVGSIRVRASRFVQVPAQCLQQLRLMASDWLLHRDTEGYNFSAEVCDLRLTLLSYVAKLSLFCNPEAAGFSPHAARNMHDDFFSFVASTGAGVSPDPVMRFATLLPSHGPYFSSEVQPLLHAALLNTAILRCASGSSAPALDLCCRLLACEALPAAFRGRCRTVLARILVHVGSKHSHEVLLALTQHSQMQPAVCSAHEAAVSLLMRDNIVPSDGMQSDADDNTNLHIAHAALLSALCVFHGNVSVALPSVQHLLARCTQSSMMWDIAASVAHSSGALRRTVACCRSAADRQRASVFSRLLKAKALICIGDGAAAVTAATDAVSATEGTFLSTTARHVLGVALGLSGSQSGSLQSQHELVRIAALL